METYRIGAIIREERNRRRISQEELCFGICSVTTLSRIENGTQKPSLKVEEALLERLGHSTENLIIYADEEEVRIHRLEGEISIRMMHYEDATDLLQEYQKLIHTRGTEAVLEKQFCVMSWAIQDFYMKRKAMEEIRKELINALHLTIPGYEDDKLYKIHLFSSAEIEIINNIALVYKMEKEYDKAIHIFIHLVNYLEGNEINYDIIKRHYNMLICNLVNQLATKGDYRETEIYSQKGIDYCMRFKRLNGLPELIYYNGFASFHLGRKEYAFERYKQAIVLIELEDRKTKADAVKEEWEILITQ